MIATSKEVGKDLDDVEQLQKNFADFKTELLANESRVEAVSVVATKMVTDGHSCKTDIEGVSQVSSHCMPCYELGTL